jgi:hypothetical protein
MLENGNILFSRQFGASEITPDKKIVWNYDGPQGTEIHTTWPMDRDRVLVMQNGNTLISGNQHGYIREVNRKGEAVWEINKNDLPSILLYTVPLRDWTALGPASSTQLLDQPGTAEQGELPRD